MNCAQAMTLLATHADGETSRLQAHSIRGHLRGCRACAARYDAIVALRGRMRDELPRHAAPAALRARVLAAVDAGERAARARGRGDGGRWRWLAAGALAGCAATMLAWFAGTAFVAWRVHEDVAVEAVGSHVRATLGGHLIEVASANQHTVKPWLSARLDYSPPVPDLSAEGFTLVGGRIDYLDGRPCATLVYRVREHVIDVYVRPESSRGSAAMMRTVRGFNVASARGAAMDWLAVSDVAPDTLAMFVQRLAGDGGPRQE